MIPQSCSEVFHFPPCDAEISSPSVAAMVRTPEVAIESRIADQVLAAHQPRPAREHVAPHRIHRYPAVLGTVNVRRTRVKRGVPNLSPLGAGNRPFREVGLHERDSRCQQRSVHDLALAGPRPVIQRHHYAESGVQSRAVILE